MKLHRLVVRAYVENDLGEVALVQSKEGFWVLPGGRVEAKECPSNALLRELEEETGLVGKEVGPLIGAYASPYRNELILLFEVKVKRFELKPPKSKREILGSRFSPKQNLPGPRTDHTHLRLEDAFAQKRGVFRSFNRPGRPV